MSEYKLNGLKNEAGFYSPLESANTFINQIVDRYDVAFKQVVVYGTNEHPLFIMKDVRAVLNIPKQTFLEHIRTFEVGVEIFRGCKVQLKSERNGNEYLQDRSDVDMLTKYGVYHAMFISNKPVARMFRRFVFIVLDKLEKDRVVYLDDALKQTELAYELQKQENLEQHAQILTLDRKTRECNELLNIVANEDDFLTTGNPDNKILQLMYKLHATPTKLYIIDPKYILEAHMKQDKSLSRMKSQSRKKKPARLCNFSSDEEDEVKRDPRVPPTKLDNISDRDLAKLYEKYDIVADDTTDRWDWTYINDLKQDSTRECYFALQPFKSTAAKQPESYHSTGTIPIVDKAHYDDMMRMLTNRTTAVPLKRVFATTWETIDSIHKDALVRRLGQMINK